MHGGDARRDARAHGDDVKDEWIVLFDASETLRDVVVANVVGKIDAVAPRVRVARRRTEIDAQGDVFLLRKARETRERGSDVVQSDRIEGCEGGVRASRAREGSRRRRRRFRRRLGG